MADINSVNVSNTDYVMSGVNTIISCTTAVGTTAKTATVPKGFTLDSGVSFLIKFTNGNTGDTTISKTNTLFMRIKTIYRFVNIDNPDEYVETIVYGDGLDTGDKAPGKAMTYADKYALMKAYKLSTGDDSDKDPSPANGYQKRVAYATPKQIEVLSEVYKDENLKKLLETNKINSINELPMKKASELIKKINEKKGK